MHRFVAFTSAAPLLPGARSGIRNLYVNDLSTGELLLGSASPGPAERFVDFRHPRISGDGQILVFDGRTSGEHGDDGFGWHVVVLDRRSESALVVQVGDDAAMRRRNSTSVISADGSAVAFDESIPLIEAAGAGARSAIYVA